MFQRAFRLPANNRLSQPHTYYSPTFIIKFVQNNLEYNRYGFIVSKKIDKRAVGRNKLRRRFRGQVEQLHPTLPQGYDFLFLLKKEAPEKTTAVLAEELIKFFNNLQEK